MSSRLRRDARREQLIDAFVRAGRRSSTATVLLHGAIAEKLGLSSTDTKTMEILERHGPLTAGELATHTGLAQTSVTSLIDRLEAKRFVRRVRDDGDRRRVIVELTPHAIARVGPAYDGLGERMIKLLQHYDNDQLALIVDFLEKSTEAVFAAMPLLGKP